MVRFFEGLPRRLFGGEEETVAETGCELGGEFMSSGCLFGDSGLLCRGEARRLEGELVSS